jgi:hypothetical protein
MFKKTIKTGTETLKYTLEDAKRDLAMINSRPLSEAEMALFDSKPQKKSEDILSDERKGPFLSEEDIMLLNGPYPNVGMLTIPKR